MVGEGRESKTRCYKIYIIPLMNKVCVGKCEKL